MDLFSYALEAKKKGESPLAARMRPKTLEEVVGQKHIIGEDKLLYRAIKADKLSSVIFYGPPGTGKTYNTVIYAVAICEGKTYEEVKKQDYEEIMARYDALKNEGRIAFTTFHQSYGYEEFISDFAGNSIGSKNLTSAVIVIFYVYSSLVGSNSCIFITLFIHKD